MQVIIKNHIKVERILSAFEQKFDKDYVFDGESHNFWELLYVVDGLLGVAEDEKIYDLKKGELVFHKPMSFHRLWSAYETSPQVIVMSFALSDTGPKELSNNKFKLDESQFRILRQALNCTRYLWKFEDDILNQLIANSIERLILTVLLDSNPHRKKTKKTKGTQNYKNIISVMNENLSESLTIDELAALCNMSASNLKKTFKKYSGIGVIDYFIDLKMKKALELIGAEMKISEISELLGYSSPHYFSEAFKKHNGMTPTEYRKKYFH